MHTIHVNEATPAQLVALLGLNLEEVKAIVEARPFGTELEFRRSLPIRVALRKPDLVLHKLDINQASIDEIVRFTEMPVAVARTLYSGRPYYFLIELRHVTGLDAAVFEKITAIFAAPEFSYIDKLSGRSVDLSPRLTEVLVRFKDLESATGQDISSIAPLTAQSRRSSTDSYQVFSSDLESGTGSQILAQLKENPSVDRTIPSFIDGKGSRRYIDPEFCVVQFAVNVSEERQVEINRSLDLQIYERHRSPGLVTLQVLRSREDPGALIRSLQALNNAPEVKFAEPAFLPLNDREGARLNSNGPAFTGNQGEQIEIEWASTAWNLDLIQVPSVWTYTRGDPNVIIAVIDSGVDEEHLAISGGILPRSNVDDWNFEEDFEQAPVDHEGHGTFIAGLLVGNGKLGIQGVCPDCRVLPLKIPITGSIVSYARRRDAILYALDYIKPHQRLVINLSWKTQGDVGLIRDAITTAVARNALVVASAGNAPQPNSPIENEPHYPSDYLPVISVGAVGPSGNRAPYSFHGNEVDLSAPGGSAALGPAGNILDPSMNIRSSAPGNTTAVAFGTSFAAPMVAGVSALILSQNMSLTAQQVRQFLESTALPLSDTGLGKGLIDASAAVEAAQAETSPFPMQGATSDNLNSINRDNPHTLSTRFGLALFTAWLLVAGRPYTRIEEIRGTFGLTDEQFTLIAGDTAATTPSGEDTLTTEPVTAETGSKLDPNQSTVEELDDLVGMPTMTARLIVARRPHANLQSLLSIIGMTDSLIDLLEIR